MGIEITEESYGRIDGTVDNGWLDDSVIDAAQTILKNQFPNIDGFQSCVLAETPCFRPVADNFAQIVNTHPKTGGLHWITITTVNADICSANVNLYDSGLSYRVSSSVEMSIANILHSPSPTIKVHYMNSDVQKNGNDCGVYATANAVEICNGGRPENVEYIIEQMRSHLRLC